ncbi:MAG TPA: hypothetical protein DCM08_04175 [Microscillaceae bacterium]|nr:hypothetical protein [Microscillaceae bacterium]
MVTLLHINQAQPKGIRVSNNILGSAIVEKLETFVCNCANIVEQLKPIVQQNLADIAPCTPVKFPFCESSQFHRLFL